MAIDGGEIKRAASGKWLDILERVGGLPSSILDGRHHPCPRCGGTDRFRALDDFAETGALFCNRCFSKGNGDGLAAIQWAAGCTFPEALRRVAGIQGPAVPCRVDRGYSSAMRRSGDPRVRKATRE